MRIKLGDLLLIVIAKENTESVEIKHIVLESTKRLFLIKYIKYINYICKNYIFIESN